MNFIKARNKVFDLWKEGDLAYKKVSQEEYKQLYYAILSHLKEDNRDWQAAVGDFLIHGAISFDRFVELRPKVADEEQYDMFCRFLNTLQKLDGKFMGRTAFFHLQKIRWDLFKKCSLKPYCEAQEELLAQCEKEARGIPEFNGDANVAVHLEQQKKDLLEFIESIRTGSIRTVIHTTLPYKLTSGDAKIKLMVDGVNVEVKAKHFSQGSTIPATRVAQGVTMGTIGPSRWTTTICELLIEAHCMTDMLEERPKVILRGGDDNGGYWTSVFDFTFNVVYAIWAYIQQQEDVPGSWPPLPNDIHYIDCHICANGKEYDHELTTNPALVYHFTPLKKPTTDIEIGGGIKPQWSVYTYMFAKLYAESGQLNEAIFWLNVSVEALVEEFIQRIGTTKEIMDEIEGEEHKFDSAEEILSLQYPEMRGKVKWPDTVIHTSVFTKLKRAIKLGGVTISQKEVFKRYSQVNARRNTLFHGGEVEISVDDVKRSFEAYGWLKDHLGT